MWIERDLAPVLVSAARSRPAVVVTGARQCGKTSLLTRTFPGHTFVSLDLPSAAAQAESEPEAFLGRYPGPVIIDEVQYAPGLFRHLKRHIDARRSERGRFLLTGSQKLSLMEAVGESLAGRVELLELLPLSWPEVHRARPSVGVVELLLRGGYPELHAEPSLDPARFYRSYAATYLERDVRQILNVAGLRDFERFLRAAALRSAQLLNMAELARDVGVSPNTAKAWLSVLAASNVAALHEPWFGNRLKSIVKSPKLYLLDAGLLAFLVGISSPDALFASPLAGALWETLVFNELRKELLLRSEAESLFFFRDRQREADFVVDRGGRYLLFDAKLSEAPSERDGASLLRVAEVLGKTRVIDAAIICRAAGPYRLPNGVAVLPLADALERLRS